MKKIMFNDKYGLTQAVLSGRKTQTRRVINLNETDKMFLDEPFDWDLRESFIIDRYAKFKVGEVVTVAQSYMSIAVEIGREDLSKNVDRLRLWQKYVDMQKSSGYNNKMFVKSELMPHHIRITNIRVERLQDISDEDCLADGIRRTKFGDSIYYYFERGKNFYSARGAYATLIDKVSGTGTWDSNPWVFVYDFELVDYGND